MNPLEENPFTVLTFIVAPAVLTNASSIMVLSTSNRLAKVFDHTQELSAQLKGRPLEEENETRLNTRQLMIGEKRTLVIVKALTAFYVSLGSFVTASLISLAGAIFALLQIRLLLSIALGVALLSGILGVSGLIFGTALLVRETHLAFVMLREEANFLRAYYRQNIRE